VRRALEPRAVASATRSPVVAMPALREAARGAQPETSAWRLSLLAAAMAQGLIAVASADVLAGEGSRWAVPLFWAGLAVLWLPPTVRLIGRDASRGERVALLVFLGMGMYVVKVLYSPRYFVQYDEFLHWRTAQDIGRTGRLFGPNPLLPVSPLYPGLEVATNAIVKLTGLSVFSAGLLVVGVARLILILALFLLYERVTGSSWLAGLATTVYFTNPHFLFFDAAYAYESLALSLAVLVLYAALRGSAGPGRFTRGAALLVILPMAATVVTHHLTSFALVISLLVLATVTLALPGVKSRLWHWGIAVVGTGFVLIWLALVASRVIDYLEPQVVGGINQAVDLIRGQGPSRHLFQSYVRWSAPPWDRAASYAVTGVILLALPLGWLRVWRTRPHAAFAVFLAIGSLAYPVSLLFHFTSIGVELSNRLSAFVFVPVSYCVAMAVSTRPKIRSSRAWAMALAALGAMLLYGGMVIGSPDWARLPGPYLVSADTRSIEPKGILAASWAKKYLGPGNRFAGDRINALLMLAYGDQRPVSALADAVDPTPLFFSPRFTSFDARLLRRSALQYLVVDYRFTRTLPWLGVYYDNFEPNALKHTRPMPVAAYAKFDHVAGVSRVFDSGDIAVFDVRGVARSG
jgi:hypothetical protein